MNGRRGHSLRTRTERGTLSAAIVDYTAGILGEISFLSFTTTVDRPAQIAFTSDDATLTAGQYRAQRGTTLIRIYPVAGANGTATITGQRGESFNDTW